MIKTVVKALEGFEKQFEEINEMKAKLDEEKELARQVALEQVELNFAERARKIDNVLAVISETEEIEVPDEPVAEEEIATENSEEVSEEIPAEEVPAEE